MKYVLLTLCLIAIPAHAANTVIINGQLCNDCTVTVTTGTAPPPVIAPPVPLPPVVTPPSVGCGPNEVFGGNDIDWTTVNSGGTFPAVGQSIQAEGALGIAIRFIPTTNRGIVGLAGYGPGATEQKEMFLSRCPHNFTTPAGEGATWRYRRQGNDLMYQWISVSGSIVGNEALLTSGQTYYLNVRPSSQSGEISFALGASVQ